MQMAQLLIIPLFVNLGKVRLQRHGQQATDPIRGIVESLKMQSVIECAAFDNGFQIGLSVSKRLRHQPACFNMTLTLRVLGTECNAQPQGNVPPIRVPMSFRTGP